MRVIAPALAVIARRRAAHPENRLAQGDGEVDLEDRRREIFKLKAPQAAIPPIESSSVGRMACRSLPRLVPGRSGEVDWEVFSFGRPFGACDVNPSNVDPGR